jgi:hypothetical protein
MQWLNIKVHTTRQERMLFAALREASKAIGSIDRLIATARQWLFDKSELRIIGLGIFSAASSN